MVDTPPNLRSDAFLGTAEAYLRYRPPYPPGLLTDLLARARVPPDSVLVDLACGPGRVALDLAHAFHAVMAIDLESEMVAACREEAAHRGIGNVVWHVGRAEDAMLAPGSVDLITIGEAFHRLDQQTVMAKASVWLKPGGCIATLGSDGVLGGSAPWKARLAAEARLWFPSGSAQGRPGVELDADGSDRVLQRAGFAEVQSHTFVEPRDWSFDEIVGYLRSMSVCSERALGEQSHAFKESLSKILGAAQPASFTTGSAGATRSAVGGASASGFLARVWRMSD